MLARLRLGVPCASAGEEGRASLRPASLPIDPNHPAPRGTHTFNPQGGQSNQQRLSTLPISQRKVDRHVFPALPPSLTCSQVLNGKESDLQFNFPMTSLSDTAVSGTIADYITLWPLRNLSNESKGPRDPDLKNTFL